MASRSSKRRRWEVDEPYCTDTSSFFRILLPGTDFRTRIEIPRKFARYCFGAKPIVPVKATLQARGVLRSATMIRRGDALFLSDDGWEGFVRDYSLQVYTVLVFNYDGSSVFDVDIGDKRCLSKKDVLSFYKGNAQVRTEFGKRTEVSSSTNTREKTPIHTPESPRILYDSLDYWIHGNKGVAYAYKVGKAAALEMANQYMVSQQKTNSSYIQRLLPTHVFGRCRLNFPKGWFNKYLTSKTNIIYMRDGSKTWKLSPIYQYSSKGTAMCVRGGWERFVKRNHLKIFDVCVISFVSREGNAATVDVKIFQEKSTTMATPQTSDTSCDLAPSVELDESGDLNPHERRESKNSDVIILPDEPEDTSFTSPPHERRESKSSDVIILPDEPEDTSFTSPPFRVTEMSSFSFVQHFERLWSSFPEEKLAQSTFLEWFHYDRYHLGKTDVLASIEEKNIFSKTYVFVPILRSGHWNLVILCHLDKCLDFESKKPCMLLLDSLHMAEPWRSQNEIRKFVSGIYKNEGMPDQRVSQKFPLIIPKVLQQKGAECGYFCLCFIKKFMETAPDYNDMAFIDESWFTRDEFEAFCKSLENDCNQEIPPCTSRILRRRRFNRPVPSKGGKEVIIIE